MAHTRVCSSCGGIAVLFALLAPVPAGATGDLCREFLQAADSGECIENVTYRLVIRLGPDHAASVVSAALRALSERESQQRALGCVGDIATQAIAAGADPDDVLEATAAGL